MRLPRQTKYALTVGLFCLVVILVFTYHEGKKSEYQWTPVSDDKQVRETADMVLSLEEAAVRVGFQTVYLTAENRSRYTAVVSKSYIALQKKENGIWYQIEKRPPDPILPGNGLGNFGGILPGDSHTYELSLVDLFPLPMQEPGEYQIYFPFYYRLVEGDPSQTLGACATIPITILPR